MKRLLGFFFCCCAAVSFAARPVAVGGYRYEARRIMGDVVNKNCWVGESVTPATGDYKKYSVVFLGELLKKVDCRYTLAVEASKRARELIGGSLPLIDTKETKPLSIAIEEINRGLISYTRKDEEELEA